MQHLVSVRDSQGIINYDAIPGADPARINGVIDANKISASDLSDIIVTLVEVAQQPKQAVETLIKGLMNYRGSLSHRTARELIEGLRSARARRGQPLLGLTIDSAIESVSAWHRPMAKPRNVHVSGGSFEYRR